jgi:hypothetical protein
MTRHKEKTKGEMDKGEKEKTRRGAIIKMEQLFHSSNYLVLYVW